MSLAHHAAPPVDCVRVVELLLVHDVPEIDAGDQIIYQAKDDTRLEKERRAAARIFGLLPEKQGALFLSRWEEFEERHTAEARFAYAIDRLMPALHNIYNNGQSWREHRVSLQKIMAVNSAIGLSCPTVWKHLRGRLEELEGRGFFEYAAS